MMKQAATGVTGRSTAGCRAFSVRCSAARPTAAPQSSRRQVLQQGILLAAGAAAGPALATSLPESKEAVKLLCDADCAKALEAAEMVTTASGLQYKDIVAGTGPQAQVGFQAVVHYVAQLPNGRIFENSLERGAPFDIRVGTGQVVPGLDEALTTMRVGGVRRVYVPGSLGFPKSIKAAAGRPTVPANSPLVFDVSLLYIPGLDLDDE